MTYILHVDSCYKAGFAGRTPLACAFTLRKAPVLAGSWIRTDGHVGCDLRGRICSGNLAVTNPSFYVRPEQALTMMFQTLLHIPGLNSISKMAGSDLVEPFVLWVSVRKAHLDW